MNHDYFPGDSEDAIRSVSAEDRSNRFQRLFVRGRDDLVAYIEGQIPSDLASTIDAQDICQEAFFEAFKHLDQFKAVDQSDGLSWLKTIARNTLIDAIRRARTTKRGGQFTVLHAADDDTLIALLQQIAIYERTPSQSAVRREVATLVQASMAKIDLNYRLALRFRFMDGLSLSDSASRLGRSEEAARKLCSRGLAALRSELGSASGYV